MLRFASVILLLPFLIAKAHQPVECNLYLLAKLTEEKLTLEVDFASFLCDATAELKFEDKIDDASLEKPLADWFHNHCPVEIDGLPVRPLVHVESEKMLGVPHLSEFKNVTMIYATVDYPLKAKPRIIDIKWGLFVKEPTYGWDQISDPDQDPSVIDVQFRVYDKYKHFSVGPEEPGYTWRPPVEVPTLAAAEGSPTGQIGRTQSANVTVNHSHWTPIIATGLIAFALALLLLTVKANAFLITVIALAGLAGMAAFHVMPPPDRSPRVPVATAAVQVFEDRLRNVYRAFDYVEDKDIYNALSTSVDGELLDTMYKDIYKSLIFSDEGGARATVTEVDITSSTLAAEQPPEESVPPTYRVTSAWNVQGDVTHFGHTHTRINKYAADCTLTHTEGGWKITEVDVTEQKRIDPDES